MGVLSEGARAHLNQSQFGIPQKAENADEKKQSGNYPIPDAKHARSALSLVSQNGSAAQKKEVRAKVHKKYPGIK